VGFRFVHAADLHLDSPFAGLSQLDPEIASLCREATFDAFKNIVQLCLDRNVDFLLIAGDVYDSATRSLRAQLAFRMGLEQLDEAGIQSYVVHGNHDPVGDWSSTLKWPDSAHVFPGDVVASVTHECRSGLRVMIHGRSYLHRDVWENLAKEFKRAPDGDFQIGLLHCNVGSETGHEPYAPCSVDDLIASGLDYWALGHVHARNVLMDNSPAVVYPGNPQGRHVKEPGPRGCYLVQVAGDGHVALEFVATDRVRWFDRHLDASGVDTEQALLDELESMLESCGQDGEGRPVLVRIAVTGRTGLHSVLARSGYIEDLVSQLRGSGSGSDPFVWTTSLSDRTRSDIDISTRREAKDLLGDLLRLTDELRSDENRLTELENVLNPVLEDRRLRKLLSTPSKDELRSLLDDAEAVCLDRLLDDSSQ